MLTGYQCEIIAYQSEGAIICRDCAVSENSTVAIEKVDMGLSNSSGLSALSRYSIDEYNGERASEWATEEVGDWTAETEEAWQKVFDDYPAEGCESCGAEIS